MYEGIFIPISSYYLSYKVIFCIYVAVQLVTTIKAFNMNSLTHIRN